MTYSAKVSGTWQPIANVDVKVSGTWRRCANVKVKVSGTWQTVWENFAASTPDWSPSGFAISTTDSSAQMRLYSNGTYQAVATGGSGDMSGTWKTGGGTGANYEARFTKMSGTTPSGDSVNTWVALSSDRAWTLTETTNGYATKTCSGHLEIRVASGATLDNSSVTMTAVVEV